MADIEIHYASNGTVALFGRDGTRLAIGDEDAVRRALIRLMGVKEIHEDYFMLGQETHVASARNIAEVRNYKAQMNAETAAAMRAEAEALLKKADELIAGGETDIPED